MELYRIAMVGDSNMEKLMEQWEKENPTAKSHILLRFFGYGGARLGVGRDGISFLDKYIDAIAAFNPDLAFCWIGGNNLGQNIVRDGYAENKYKEVFNLYMELVNEINGRIVGKCIAMPQFPRTSLERWSPGMTWDHFYDQVSKFNKMFRSRKIKRHRCYQISGKFFKRNGTHWFDGVHLKYTHYGEIASDLMKEYVSKNIYHD